MMRRSAIQEVGGFVTDSISEDYYTGIRLSAKGYESVYLNETLSAGLAAESMSAHILQRLRWARGTLQGLFIDSNPFIIPGLRLRQRLAHLEGFITWFSILPRLFFIIIPIIYSFFGIEPLAITLQETIYIFLPYYLLQLTTFTWLNQRSRSIILSDVYAVVSCFPLFIAVVKVMFNPFGQGFKVTPKGLFRSKNQYNWRSAFPLIIFLIGTVLSLWITLGINNYLTGNYFSLVVFWNIYNIIIISVALLGLLDIPKPDIYEWLPMQQKVQLTSGEKIIWGTITQLSEVGAEIQLKQFIALDGALTLAIPEVELTLSGKLTYINLKNSSIRVKFESITPHQSRRLIEFLFCRPGQWKYRNTPGEWRSLWLLFRVLFRPVIFLFGSFDKDKRKKREAIF